MQSAIDASFDYTNLQGLAGLRNESSSPEAQRAIARQFASLFLSMMIKQMRSATAIEGGLIDNRKLEFQQSMFDEQLALSLARGRGIGLADSILRSLGMESAIAVDGSREPSLPPVSNAGSTATAPAIAIATKTATPTPTTAA